MPADTPESPPRNQAALWGYVFFLGVGALAIALRLPELGSKGLWLDEAYSVVVAELPLAELLEKLAREGTPPLYYLCLKPWLAIFGSSEAAARSLSLLFSVAGIGVVGAIAQRFFSLRVASVVTLMLAFTPLHVYYAQEARMYALLALLGAALTLASLEFLARRSPVALALSALLSVLMLLTHSIAGAFLLGVNAAFFALCRERRMLVQWLGAQALALLCYAPWLSIALEQLHEQRSVLAWFEPFWNARSAIGHFMTSIGSFALGSFPPYLAIPSPLETAPLLRGGVLLLAGFGLYRWHRNANARFVAVTLFVALALSLGYSALAHPIHIPGRTDHALLPLFVLLLALGIDELKPPLLRGALLLVGMIGALATLQIYHDYAVKNDSRTYLWELQASLAPGDIVVTTGLTWAETSYYLRRWNVPAPILPFPKAAEAHPGYLNYRELMRNPAQLYADAEEVAEYCKQHLGHDNAVFIVYLRPLNVNGIVTERLLRDYPNAIEVGSQRFRQGVLGLPVRIVRLQAANAWRATTEPKL